MRMEFLDRFGLCQIILDHSYNLDFFGPFGPFGPFWTVLDHFGPFGPFWTVWTILDRLDRLDCLDRFDNFGPFGLFRTCLLYTSPSPRDATLSRMPSSA